MNGKEKYFVVSNFKHIYSISFVGIACSYDREASNAEACKSRLIQIYVAKQVWAVDKNMPKDATPTNNDLVPEYLHTLPACPSGGTYTIGKVSECPTCSIKEHNLTPSEFEKEASKDKALFPVRD